MSPRPLAFHPVCPSDSRCVLFYAVRGSCWTETEAIHGTDRMRMFAQIHSCQTSETKSTNIQGLGFFSCVSPALEASSSYLQFCCSAKKLCRFCFRTCFRHFTNKTEICSLFYLNVTLKNMKKKC